LQRHLDDTNGKLKEVGDGVDKCKEQLEEKIEEGKKEVSILTARGLLLSLALPLLLARRRRRRLQRPSRSIEFRARRRRRSGFVAASSPLAFACIASRKMWVKASEIHAGESERRGNYP